MRSAIHGIGAAVPERVVPNPEVAKRAGVTEEWIVARTGVRERHHVRDGERLDTLAASAGRQALDEAGVAPEDVDLVLVATLAADELTPNAAPLVAEQLGAHRAGAMDVGAACTGYLSALSLAAAQIECGRCEHVLVIGVDVLSRFTDPADRGTAALFADGAGAIVLAEADGPGLIGPVTLGADGGAGADLIRVERDEALIRMQGQETFRHAVARLSEATLEATKLAGVGLGDIDLFVYHQANGRILRAVGERLELPPERVIDCIERYGNTSAATLPLALAAAESAGRLKSGHRVLLGAFGAGFTWGAAVIEWL
jgi:3-oxoacyl-[acyl-carrier-protein] synthase-3